MTQATDPNTTNALSAPQQRLMDYLRIPSISTDPAYKEAVLEAATWTKAHLDASGFSAVIMPTSGHPVVVGKTTDDMVADPKAPRVLFYGHYDVQPPDPLELWTSPPFEPVIKDGKVFARGASDDKGQVLCFLEALRRFHEAGEKLPCHVTVMIEGEEEAGSVGLGPFLDANADLLAADICVVSDTSLWDTPDGWIPAITYAMRGLVYYDIKLHGPARDLHSGVYGNTLANPATELMKVVGRLKDTENRVTIPGFYDDVEALTDVERAEWEKLGFDEATFTGSVGATPFGETGFTTLENRWVRPSCDVNGMYGGYMGEGAKTVIPSFAGCKVSFRIPAAMDPKKVAQQFEAWLKSHNVGGCRWELTNHGEAYPVAVSRESPFMAAASAAIEAVDGRKPALIREGATIPVIADFKTLLGLDTLLVGFGLNADNIHSPDEHFALDRFELGINVHHELLKRIAAIQPVS